jgi:predicted nucleotidyltransferase
MVTKNVSQARAIRLLLKDIVERLNKSYGPEKIILYGSYAYGNPTTDSDIDLLIIKDTAERHVDRFVEVKKIIYQPGRNIPVSLLIYTPKKIEERLKMGDYFVAEILAKGKVLYAR